MAYGELHEEGRTRAPLDPGLRRGLISITILSMVSFITTTVLFLYLTYKLVAWHFIRDSQRVSQNGVASRAQQCDVQPLSPLPPQHHAAKSSQQTSDFVLGIDGLFTEPDRTQAIKCDDRSEATKPLRTKNTPNQFLVLIYNLLLADMHQSAAFILNSSWLRQNGVMVHTATCFTQGLFVSTGDLASSMFITSIAIHTYLSVVRGYRPSQNTLYIAVAAIWVFVYAISTIPIAVTRNGAAVGGFFVRAGAWCWMNEDYEVMRLLTHYLYIFMGLFTTSVLYIAIFFHLRRQALDQHEPFTKRRNGKPRLQLHHNPAFLIYPVIYVMCTLPLASGRIATMADANVPISYYCFAGGIISFNGFFDCLLFGTTRNSIIFASKYDVDVADTGLDTFAFLKTPLTRRYGNMIWVQGGRRRKQDDTEFSKWWPWARLSRYTESRYRSTTHRSVSEESLRGRAIQLDMITSVTVEMEQDTDGETRHPLGTAVTDLSVDSTEKDTGG